jgi:hypothetical protein
LEKAHILPRQFYHSMRRGARGFGDADMVPRIYFLGQKRKPKQSQSGIYDSKILCSQCEDLIGPWDRYAQELFLQRFPRKPYIAEDGKSFYSILEYDYKSLKLFFLSVLWRSAVSTHEFFAGINIEECEERLRSMLLAQNPGSSFEFPVMVIRYEGVFRDIMPSPSSAVIHDARIHHFRVPGYGWIIQTNDAPPSQELDQLRIRPGEPLVVKSIRFKHTYAFNSLLHDVRAGKLGE